MLPRLLRKFAIFVDGVGYAGMAEEVELPKLKIKTEDFRSGGMDAPSEQDMGMEKLEGTITVAEYNPAMMSKFGLLYANTPITLRGAIQRQNEEAIPVIIKMTGGFKELDKGTWKAGDKGSMKIGYSADLYSEEVDGQETLFIDVVNCIRRVGGVDQLASQRAALGI